LDALDLRLEVLHSFAVKKLGQGELAQKPKYRIIAAEKWRNQRINLAGGPQRISGADCQSRRKPVFQFSEYFLLEDPGVTVDDKNAFGGAVI
jgi:hypothetical protein